MLSITSELFRTIPKPLYHFEAQNNFGVHPVVCCPGGYAAKKPIFFPSDYVDDYEGVDYDYNYDYQQPVQQEPKVRSKDAFT